MPLRFRLIRLLAGRTAVALNLEVTGPIYPLGGAAMFASEIHSTNR